MKAAFIAVGVLALLAAVIWPKAVDLDRYVVEGETRGALAALKIQVEEHKKTRSRPPETLSAPPVLWKTTLMRAPHPKTSAVVALSTGAANDAGGWGYDAASGAVFINCTHTDTRGGRWADY